MNGAPRGVRLHVGFFGRRNAGKSSLVNALCGEAVSVTSDVPGTTTDPVEKALEVPGLGPVVLIDTPGLDDSGDLGSQRVERARRVLERVDVAVVVARGDDFGPLEDAVLGELARRGVPSVVASSHADVARSTEAVAAALAARGLVVVRTAATRGEGVSELREALVRIAPQPSAAPVVGDLVGRGDVCVLVVPIDSEAPAGRLILPQVQVLRDLLDHGALAVVTREHELAAALGSLRAAPALVITDSQAFAQVAAVVPPEVPLTSFSVLMARHKGDLAAFVAGAAAIDGLRPADRVLVAEACSHHPTVEDIGRVKLPRWLARVAGGDLAVDVVSGRDFPADLADYRLVVHCGGCMLNRAAVLARVRRCREAGVPITNYGLAIARSLGILERALAPFGASGRQSHPVTDASGIAPR